VEGRSKARKNP